MIHFVCWKWNSDQYCIKFEAEHVNVLARMLQRNYGGDYRLVCVTDDTSGVTECETFPLWDDHRTLANPTIPGSAKLPSCYRRLKLFDGATTRSMGIADGALVASIDLDVVLINDLEPLLIKQADFDFMGWRAFGGAGWRRPWYFQGSLWRLRAGHMQKIWDKFNAAESPRRVKAEGYFGSDQGWISMCLEGAGYPFWSEKDGVISYRTNLCRVRGRGGALPRHARIIAFNGPNKPWDADVQARWPWVADFWHA